MKKKIAVIAMVVTLVAAIAVGGTLAYLNKSTAPITNTFVVGNIGNLTLTEPLNPDGDDYVIVPEQDITKDPTVSFTPADGDNNVPVYVFVKIDGTGWTVGADNKTYTISENANTLMSWEVDTTEWTYLQAGVYYKALAADTALAATGVIKDDTIAVTGNVNNANIDDLAAGATLTFTSYAIQQTGFADAATAYAAAIA